MQVVILIRLNDLLLRGQCTTDSPTIQRHHVFNRNDVCGWVEAVQVRQEETCGVTNTTVRIRRTLEDLI
ncbi:Uncharacterised protein [Vibrio cholerae]|nr:Uncharacterised protein [Vibrio cholerae]